jgi:hypothetical protein
LLWLFLVLLFAQVGLDYNPPILCFFTVTGLNFFFFLVILVVLRTSCLLGRCSTTQATLPAFSP